MNSCQQHLTFSHTRWLSTCIEVPVSGGDVWSRLRTSSCMRGTRERAIGNNDCHRMAIRMEDGRYIRREDAAAGADSGQGGGG
jgi:hypothetical protein